jgi:hypothetical protein
LLPMPGTQMSLRARSAASDSSTTCSGVCHANAGRVGSLNAVSRSPINDALRQLPRARSGFRPICEKVFARVREAGISYGDPWWATCGDPAVFDSSKHPIEVRYYES